MKRSLTFATVLAIVLSTASAWAAPALPGLTLQRQVGHLVVGVTPEGRVATWDVTQPQSPQKRSERDPGGPVVDLRVVDGTVFVVVGRHEVQAFALAPDGTLDLYRAPTTTSASAQPVAAARRLGPAVVGRIETVSRGHVLITLEDAAALRPGDAVLVRSQLREMRMNLFTGREEEVVSNAPTAVLEVRQVQGGKAVAELARGDSAGVGDTVETTDRKVQGSHLHAARTGYNQWARMTVRPFLNFGDVDVGSVTDLAYGLYWKSMHIQARVAPIGLSVPNAVDAVNAQVILSYQNDYAEFGVGSGYFRHAFEGESQYDCDDSGYIVADAAKDGSTPSPTYKCKQQGPSVVQHLRLGTVDGLHVRMTNTLAIDSGKFRFGYFEASADVPVSREINLYGAGGGSTGMQWGEVGMRTYLRGIGGHDTLILSTGLGGSTMRTASMYGGKIETPPGGGSYVVESPQKSVGGLHIAVGLEWRL